MKKCLTCTLLLMSMLCWMGCDRFDGDDMMPSYISIDAINVEDDVTSSWSYYEGFFRSEVESVNIVVYFEGDTAETNLGAYQLPCKVPMLRHGVAKYVSIVPVVKQNGIAATRIRYPFYKTIKLTDVPFQNDSVTALGTLTTKYESNMKVAWKEFFEPLSYSFLLDPDSVVTAVGGLDSVCSDYGSGMIRIRPDQNYIHFWIDEPIELLDASAYVYLELDFRSNVPLSIGFNNPDGISSSNTVESMITLNPSPEWQKMYINMGRLWSQYNYYSYIRLYFTILNDDGIDGAVYLDNMKVVTI